MDSAATGLRADLRQRATDLKKEVAHLETLPLASRIMAGIGSAMRGMHLVADFVLHVIPEEMGEVIDHKPDTDDQSKSAEAQK